MNLQLPDSIWSKDDLTAVIVEIQAYGRWYAAAQIKRQVTPTTARTGEPPALSPAAVSLLKAADSSGGITQAAVEQLIHALQQIAQQNDQLTITLAAPASGSLKRSLVQWCRANITPGIFIAFRFNATILGGMVVQYGSHIYDWSFRRRILESREHFPEVLRHV